MRRLVLGIFLIGLGWAIVPAMAAPYTRDFALTIRFGGSTVGTIAFRFERKGDVLIVGSELEIVEKDGDVVVYERRESRREVWRDGDVVDFTNDIVENGKRSQVTAARIGGRLAVSGPEGTNFAPVGALPGTFWSIDVVDRRSIFNVRSGQVLLADTVPIPPVKMRVAGREQLARQFIMAGDVGRNLFYAEDNRWLGMRYLGRDARMVDYLPE